MRAFFGRIGGKSRLAPTIVGMMPEHERYVEPFVGAGWVLFRKPPSKEEIVNDVDTDIYSLFTDIQHVTATDMESHVPRHSREFFYEQLAASPTDPVERFKRNLFISKNSFASGRRTYAGDNRCTAVTKLKSNLEAYKQRLSKVTIHNKDWREVVKEYDSPTTLHYLDPPYSAARKSWGYKDHVTPAQVAEVCRGIQGRFICSYDDSPVVREAFAGFNIREVEVIYKVCVTSNNKRVREVIITNF